MAKTFKNSNPTISPTSIMATDFMMMFKKCMKTLVALDKNLLAYNHKEEDSHPRDKIRKQLSSQ